MRKRPNGIIRPRVLETLERFAGEPLSAAEVSRWTDFTEKQVSDAMAGLAALYPEVTRTGRLTYRYDPLITKQAKPDPRNYDAMAGERAAAMGFDSVAPLSLTEHAQSGADVSTSCETDETLEEMRGELFEIIDRDKDTGLFVLTDSLRAQRFLLVRQGLMRQMQKQLADYGQVEAFKKALRALVNDA